MSEKLTKRQKQAETTKTHIYDTAMSLFANCDYESVTVKQICEAAEVSVGSFYHHYCSKDDLLLSIYPKFDEFVETELIKKTYSSNLDAIRDLIYYQTVGFNDYKPNFLAQILRLQLSFDKYKYVIQESRYINKYLSGIVEKAMRDGDFDPSYSVEEVVEFILRISRGVLFDWALRGGDYCLEDKAIYDLNLIFGLLQRPSEL